jgi:carbamoyltransferase
MYDGDPVLIVAIAANAHDSSVAVADEERVLVVVEAERIYRRKRAWCNAPALEDLVAVALASLGRTIDDVTHWCGSAMLNGLLPMEDRTTQSVSRTKMYIAGGSVPATVVNHHLAHAASFFASPFDAAIVDACDGGGDGRQHVVFEASRGSGGACLEEVNLATDDSFSGVFYDVCSYYLYKRYCQEGRLMGLAAFGEADLDAAAWLDERAEALSSWPHERSYVALHRRFGIDRFDADDRRCRDFANAVQAVFERRRAEQVLSAADPARPLVLCGGATLNIHANSRIALARGGAPVFAPPFCDDTGQALGALLYVAAVDLGLDLEVQLPFLGIANVEERELEDEVAERIVDDLLVGKVVAFHWGRAEIGPRALGHRSLLCAPLTVDDRRRVSERVKGREWYRPVAPMVRSEDRPTWFDGDWDSPYMLFATNVRDRTREQAPAVAHIDGTARVQTIETDHVLDGVLRRFGEATGVPVLINTSLNGPGEPIAQSHADTTAFARQCPDVVAYVDGHRVAPA